MACCDKYKALQDWGKSFYIKWEESWYYKKI